MARLLPTNTALRLVVGPILTGSATLPTSVTVTSVTLHAWSEANDGGAPTTRIDSVLPTASGGSNDMVYLSPGSFDLEVTASQLNWLGRGKFQISQGSVLLPYSEDWLVVPATTYNGLVRDTDKLPVYASSVADPAGVTTGNAAINSITAYVSPSVSSIYNRVNAVPTALHISSLVWEEVIADHGTVGTFGEVETAADVAAEVWDLETTGHDTVGTFGEQLKTDLDAMKVVTDKLDTTLALDGTVWDFTAAALAAAGGAVDTALAAIHLDHLLAADYDPASKPGVATALLNELIESNAGVSRYTAAALDQAPSGTGASATAISSTVWAQAIPGAYGAGSAAVLLNSASAGGGGGGASAADVSSAVWGIAVPGAYSAGTAGKLLGDNLTTPVSSLSVDVPAALARTNSIIAHVSPAVSSIYGGMATAAALSIVDDFIDTEVAALVANVNSLTAYVTPSVSSIYGGMATEATVTSLTAYVQPAALGDAVLDEAVEGAYTLRQATRLIAAASAGKLSGAGTSSITIRDLNDTADRITAAVDADGNRAIVTKDVS